MVLILDLIIVAILAIFTMRGYLKGFVRAVTGLIGGILAFLGARVAAGLLTSTAVEILPFPGIGSSLASFIRTSFLNDNSGHTASQLLKDYGIPDPLAEGIGQKVGDRIFTDSQELLQGISDALDYYMTYIIVFIVSFIMLYILIMLLSTILDGVMKLPVLNLANKLGGLVAGLCGGLVFAFCITLLISWLAPILDSLFDITINADVIQKTVLFKFMAGFNPLKYIL